MGGELNRAVFGNMTDLNRVNSVPSCDQEPAKCIVWEARDKGFFLDATHARKVESTMVMDTRHVAVVSISPETISSRLSYVKGEAPSEE
jgi:regulator of extracellular matrix RemA (YlzA/DUF370 family)